MKVTISWTATNEVTSQLVQYKLATTSSWTDYGYVAIGANSATIADLLDNYIYDFRVLTSCDSGTVTASAQTSRINIVCPNITTSVTGTTVNYSFNALNGSVTGYVVKLYNSTGTTLIGSPSTPALSNTTIAGTFSSLTNSTTYKLELTVNADTKFKVCPQITVVTNTSSASSCNPPTGVTSYLV